MEYAKQMTYKGLTITAYYDEYTESPDKWDNKDYFLVYDHRDFTVERKGFDPEDIFQELSEKKRTTYEGYFCFPVYAYIHSGVSLSLGRNKYPFTDSWDTSCRGFALIKRERGTWSEKQAHKAAEGLVSEWNQYLSGDVYGIAIEDNNIGADFSVWGYYGREGMEYGIQEAKMEIDRAHRQHIAKHLSKLKAWITNKVPFTYRHKFITT